MNRETHTEDGLDMWSVSSPGKPPSALRSHSNTFCTSADASSLAPATSEGLYVCICQSKANFCRVYGLLVGSRAVECRTRFAVKMPPVAGMREISPIVVPKVDNSS